MKNVTSQRRLQPAIETELFREHEVPTNVGAKPPATYESGRRTWKKRAGRVSAAR
jgi:hypothetical protein